MLTAVEWQAIFLTTLAHGQTTSLKDQFNSVIWEQIWLEQKHNPKDLNSVFLSSHSWVVTCILNCKRRNLFIEELWRENKRIPDMPACRKKMNSVTRVEYQHFYAVTASKPLWSLYFRCLIIFNMGAFSRGVLHLLWPLLKAYSILWAEEAGISFQRSNSNFQCCGIKFFNLIERKHLLIQTFYGNPFSIYKSNALAIWRLLSTAFKLERSGQTNSNKNRHCPKREQILQVTDD